MPISLLDILHAVSNVLDAKPSSKKTEDTVFQIAHLKGGNEAFAKDLSNSENFRMEMQNPYSPLLIADNTIRTYFIDMEDSEFQLAILLAQERKFKEDMEYFTFISDQTDDEKKRQQRCSGND